MKKVIVIGGGHAGIEASLALTKMKINVSLITGDLSKVASLPCNPSIGGPAKGIVVREIDALGGQMAKSADYATLQIKMLNSSKGPAVRALRAQIDKVEYPKYMLSVLKMTDNLNLLEGYVENLLIEDNSAIGVVLEDGREIFADAVILATGTYLNSRILVGDKVIISGPSGEKTTSGISAQLKELGFEIIRLKTGTPPRLAKESVNINKLALQYGDEGQLFFSYDRKKRSTAYNLPCYLTYTNSVTHSIINQNIAKSAMYSGNIKGIGPRYCPSVEDKIMRFKDKERHQIFLEPESIYIDEFYVQGLSTSMPIEIQEEMVHSIIGLENAIINKGAYAIEYDAINPTQLYHSLESKKINGLFFAGQINGTSGYEEAAGQGLMAGINVGLKLQKKKPLILRRDEAYIGVLIDDLVTKGTQEPYRLLTSRAEYRLLLRHDNADIRLSEYGYRLGLIDEEKYQKLRTKIIKIDKLIQYAKNTRIEPTEENNDFFKMINSAPIYNKVILEDIIKRPEVNSKNLSFFIGDSDDDILEQVDLQIKYEGYIKKSFRDAEKLKRLEAKHIPSELNYDDVRNISSEAKEKLKKIKPITLGQASRILGVNPTDILVLSVYIESGEYKK